MMTMRDITEPGTAVTLPDQTITRVSIAENERMRFMPQLFPARIGGLPGFIWGETQLYNFAKRLSTDYNGGFWLFYRLSNNGLYAAPELDAATVAVKWADNYFDGAMTPDGFGIVTTLYALSAACCVTPTDAPADRYHALRDYAVEHNEASLIFRAID